MRLLLVLLINATVLGGLAAYMNLRPGRVARQVVFQEEKAAGAYSVEVTTTFSAQPDPFSLPSAEEEPPPSLLIRFRGRDVLRLTDEVPAGQPIRLSVDGIVVGDNEFYVAASPPLDQADQAHAVRVKILRDGRQVAERTLWSRPRYRASLQDGRLVTEEFTSVQADPFASESGSRAEGTITLTVEPVASKASDDERDHAH
ncbi:MAG: hypothetical protein N2C14_00905 [Planctomycetales bacterium]